MLKVFLIKDSLNGLSLNSPLTTILWKCILPFSCKPIFIFIFLFFFLCLSLSLFLILPCSVSLASSRSSAFCFYFLSRPSLLVFSTSSLFSLMFIKLFKLMGNHQLILHLCRILGIHTDIRVKNLIFIFGRF